MAEFDLSRLAAEDEITRLMFAYCSTIDTGNLDATAALFAKGTWYLNPESPLSGTDDVAAFLNDSVILYEGVPATRHVVSNIRIELAADRRSAHVDSYVIVFQCLPGSVPKIMFQGAFDDTFAHDGSAWHFDVRRIHTDGTGDMSGHLRGAQPVAAGSP